MTLPEVAVETPDPPDPPDPPDRRRLVPRTDLVLADPRLQAATARLGPATVKRAVVAAQARARTGEIAPTSVADAAVAALPASLSGTRSVLNATGVVLHTNLGRASLPPAAIDALVEAGGYADVEYDLEAGTRARRGRSALAALQEAVPAAESVLVVNNGAAALVLATTALAAGREVVISRGEMVEIGDGFRLHELIASTGARLCEVGTTNRTSLADYAAAVGPETGCILKVHPSNFRVEGFTSAVDVAALAALGVPVVADIGSGLLAPDPLLPDEPDADTALRAGAAVVTASGDKLLGGPQAGLLLGVAAVLERLRRHPLARALRVDKLTLAALEATLRGPVPPTWMALRADVDALHERAEQITGRLREHGVEAEVVSSDGAVGGGGAPGLRLPGWAVAVRDAYAPLLRLGTPAVVGRVERGRCLLDLRCVPPDHDRVLVAAVLAVADASRTTPTSPTRTGT
ncbi:MAG TPA: L-seryl-tRNA(Sec) selenium transferase [Propionibacteriaceae bacterium]